MTLNLTPRYHQAEARYKAAGTPEDKLAALEDMWREVPKHKSSEKLQAELKKKLSTARKALQQPHNKGASRVDPFHIPKSGAGQVVLIGTPNVGKSSIVGGLSHAHVKIGDYPFTTALPAPGMVAYEDIQIQLVDTPPVTAEHVLPGFAGMWLSADAIIVVVDAAADTLLEDVETCLTHLTNRHVELTDGPRRPPAPETNIAVPGFVLANKMDAPGAEDGLALLRDLVGEGPRVEAMSAHDPERLARLPRLLFELIRVIRVYAKPIGKKPDLEEPFVLRAGGDIHEMARHVYRGLENRITSARIWGHGVADGQQVHLDHILHDKDIVELHA